MNIIQNIGRITSRACTERDIEETVKPAIPLMEDLCNRPCGRYTHGAYAIAHCQVEQKNPLRFFVLKDGSTVVNPVIIERRGDPISHIEGCMSFAYRDEKSMKRWPELTVEFAGIDQQGNVSHHRIDVDGMEALVFQHEIDHMNGRHLY